MFPMRLGERVQKPPSKRPMLDGDDVSHGLQDELANIGDRDEDYDTSLTSYSITQCTVRSKESPPDEY